MATNVKLPELGEGVTEGELIKWLVKPGDAVKADQPVAEMMTDKATVEVPSPQAGVVKDLLFKTGDVVKVESVILTLEGGTQTSTKNGAQSTPTNHSTSSSSNMQTQNSPASSSASGATASSMTSASTSGAEVNVKLPELGEGVTEGELIKWLVKPGDTVRADQPVAEMMTDKATVEVPSPQAGVVKTLKFKTGDVVKVESVILTLASNGGAPTKTAITSQNPSQASQPMATQSRGPLSTHSQTGLPSSMHTAIAAAAGAGMDVYPPVADFRVLATPATRRLAREMGIDINQIKGTGLAGRVTREDVLSTKPMSAQTGLITGTTSAAPTGSTPTGSIQIPRPAYTGPAGAVEERVAIRGVRKKIAENMQMSKSIIPHFTLMDEADVTELVALRESLKDTAEKKGTKITYLPFVMKALIATIREFPMFNASIDDAAQEIVYKKYFNIGFAADTPNGLVVPVIKNADQKTIIELSKEILDLSKRARDGKLKMEEMKGATITITNIGSVGGTYATPIINHPEVAILGMYKIQDKITLGANKEIQMAKAMNFTITADHRLIDGAVAANFLKSFLSRIQKPSVLMMDMI